MGYHLYTYHLYPTISSQNNNNYDYYEVYIPTWLLNSFNGHCLCEVLDCCSRRFLGKHCSVPDVTTDQQTKFTDSRRKEYWMGTCSTCLSHLKDSFYRLKKICQTVQREGCWLTTLPPRLHPPQTSDALSLRCCSSLTVEHALSCAKGGIRHNEIRDLTADLLATTSALNLNCSEQVPTHNRAHA